MRNTVINMLGILAIWLLASLASGEGEFMTGNSWLKMAQSDNDTVVAMAVGYAVGVHDAHAGVTSCTPNTFEIKQLGVYVVKKMTNNPEILHITADRIISNFLKNDFPCEDDVTLAPSVIH